MRSINLRESLLKIDKATGFKYTLVDLYEACSLNDDNKKKLAQYIEDKDVRGMSKLLSNEAGVMTENVSDDLTDEELMEAGWNPNLTDCPECGDISFDSERGKCTKCNYKESWMDDDGDEQEYKFIDRKSVRDSDGFLTDYTWYKSPDGVNVFVFGDSDMYRPENGDFDFEEESDHIAQQWFDSYNGFGDDLDEGIFAVAGDAIGRGIKDVYTGVKNVARGVKDVGVAATHDVGRVANSVKQSKVAAKARDAKRAMKGAETVDQFKNDYKKRQQARSRSDAKRDKVWNGRKGKTYGDIQDWTYVVDGKKYKYDDFIKLPGYKRKNAKKYDISGNLISFADQERRLNASLIREGRQLNEGPGAGYTIASSGYGMSGTLNGFSMSTRETRHGSTEYIFDCDVSLNGEVEYFEADGYYSGTGAQHYLPITCNNVVVEVEDSDLVSLGIFSEDAYETGSLEDNNVDMNGLYETIVDALGNASCSFTYGGGWSHATYDGQVTDDYLSSTYLVELKADIYLSDEEDIQKVDRMTSGYGYETVYMVGDPGSYDEGFEDEDEAIAYAKENGYTEVRISYESENWNGDIDSEFGDVVWTADEVEESLTEGSITIDQRDREALRHIRDYREHKYDIEQLHRKLERVYGNKGTAVPRLADLDELSDSDIDRILGESVTDGLNTSSSSKTFSQWFDEVMSFRDDEFYPFDNYVKTFPSADYLRNATATDIRDNAHIFYDVYDVDSADREKAFNFASEELGLDYDVLYYAWLRESPITASSKNSSKEKVPGRRTNESASKPTGMNRRDRTKFITLATKGLTNKGYTKEEANDIAIKWADNVGTVYDSVEFEVRRRLDMALSKDEYDATYKSVKESYTHFTYKSGANPYIAKTGAEVNKLLSKYKGNVTEIKPGFYEIDDTESDSTDLFKFDDELTSNESLETSKEWEHRSKDGKIGRIRQSDDKGDRKLLTRDQAAEIAKFRGHEDDELYPVNESESINKIGDTSLTERVGPTHPEESKIADRLMNIPGTTKVEFDWANAEIYRVPENHLIMLVFCRDGFEEPYFENRRKWRASVLGKLRTMGWTLEDPVEDNDSYLYLVMQKRRAVTEDTDNPQGGKTKYKVTWKVINVDDSYVEESKEVFAKDEKSAKATVKDKRARDIKAVKMTEAFKHPQFDGPWWYLCKHGIGPGALPKGVTVVDTVDDEENPNRVYVALDKVLTTDELRQFEMIEKKPDNLLESVSEESISNMKDGEEKVFDLNNGAQFETFTKLHVLKKSDGMYSIWHSNDDGSEIANETKYSTLKNTMYWINKDTNDGVSESLTEADDNEFIRFEVVPDNRKWQYSVGGKDVPYTSYEDAVAHIKDDYNICDYRQELQQYLKSNGFDYFVDETFDGRLCIEIHWGDWRHEHQRADYLVRHFFMDKGLGVHVDEQVTDEDGSDCYSADHYYSINDLYFSGRVVD